jgi:hypothetical protein
MRRRTLIHLCITLTLALTACVVFYWKFVRPFFLARTGDETPKELRDAGVRVGEGVLTRAEFVRVNVPGPLDRFFPGIGDTTDVAVGEFDGQPGTDVVVAGRLGARVFDAAGAPRSETKFEFGTRESFGPLKTKMPKWMVGDVSVKDLDGDGVCEYLARGGMDGAALFGHGGALLWSYGAFEDGKGSIDDLAAGDLDGDGSPELVSGWGKLEAFDRGGQKIWERPWKPAIYALEVADADGDGRAEIIVAHGRMGVLDSNGEQVRDVELPFYLSRFSVLRGPRGGESLVAVKDGSVWTFDSKGVRVRKLPAPLAEIKVAPHKAGFGEEGGGFDFTVDSVDAYDAKGAWVKLDPARPEMLAVITYYVALDRSVLYVYDASGTLLYEEVMPEQCLAVAALPAPEGRPQEFLVGCDSTVFRYAPR